MTTLDEKIDTARRLFEEATGGNTVKARRSTALIFEVLEDINDILADLVDFVFPEEEEPTVPPFSSLAQVLPKEEEDGAVEDAAVPLTSDDSEEARVPEVVPSPYAVTVEVTTEVDNGYDYDGTFPEYEVPYEVEPRAKRARPSAATEEEDGA